MREVSSSSKPCHVGSSRNQRSFQPPTVYTSSFFLRFSRAMAGALRPRSSASHLCAGRCMRTGHECVDQIPPLFGGPARKSAEWTGLAGSGKKYKRSLGGEGEGLMMGHEAVMYLMARQQDDGCDAWPGASPRPLLPPFTLDKLSAALLLYAPESFHAKVSGAAPKRKEGLAMSGKRES